MKGQSEKLVNTAPRLLFSNTEVAVFLSGFALLSSALFGFNNAANAQSSGAETALASRSVPESGISIDELIARQLVRVEQFPHDANARFSLAELYRQSGRSIEAAREYLATTALNPTYYVAYHKLLEANPNQEQVDEAFERLKELRAEQPKELLLRVALSEVLEYKKDYYLAARTLVDFIFANPVPPKYVNRVNSRIRHLLAEAKQTQATEKVTPLVKGQSTISDEEQDTPAPPLPETTLHQALKLPKSQDPNMTKGFGNATLLP